MNADGSRKKRLTVHAPSDNLPGLTDSEPDWSPNGTEIAFTRGRQSRTDPEPRTEIDVMNANGSSQTRLTRFRTNAYSPAWSPDGKKIAFVLDWKAVDSRISPADIYVMNANGSGQTRLTQGAVNADHNSVRAAYEPTWSPDGKRIAYTVQTRDDTPDSGIYVMNADGSGQTLVTGTTEASGPAWSPDGTKIAFTSARAGSLQGEIYVINPDGSGQTQLTQSTVKSRQAHFQPAWSPDGTKIAYTRHVQATNINSREIYEPWVMNANGSGQRRLSQATIVGTLDWGPVPTGRRNPLPAPPRTVTAHPSLRLRCIQHVQAVRGPVLEALVAPSAGVLSVNFSVNGRSYGDFTIPPIFLRFPVSGLPKTKTWTIRAVATIVAGEAQTAWVKRVFTKRHAARC